MNKIKLSAVAIFVALASNAHASLVNANIDYQEYRNFAENKGKYQVGAVNIPVYDKQGNLLGTALPKDIPMPDFSAVDSNRYLSGLVGNQYIASVKHNSDAHFVGTRFGQDNKNYDVYAYQYLVVDRNDHSILDYNTPRLNKMVTEVHAAELPQNFSAKDLLNGRYIAFARAGSGTQAIQEGNNITIQHNAYKFPTGGTPLNMKDNTGDMVGTIEGSVLNPKSSTGPLVSYGTKGDSGSPLWGFDKELKRWVMIGNVAQYYGYDYIKNNYMVTQNNFLRQNELDDTAAALNIKSTKPIYWDNTESGKSRITSELNHADIDVKKGNNLNNGKDVVFKGQTAIIQLNDNIDQGAGGLYFLNSATVKGKNDNITHIGSGIYVDENQTVHWQVKNPKNDRLSKLGKGVLVVDGNGNNTGDISVGDGTVYLSQNGGTAFNTARLASGDGKIVLKDANQAKNYQFDHRGGTLDVNGNDLSFAMIRHVDDGARIINGNTQKASTITLNPTSDKYYLGDFGTTPSVYQKVDRIYSQKDVKSIDISDFVNNDGQMNLALVGSKTYTLQGNTNLKGDVSVSGSSTMIFKGAPTAYADIIDNGTHKVENDEDWKNRIVNAENYRVTDQAKLQFDRNLTSVNGNFIANKNAQIQLGSLTNKQVKTTAEGKVTLQDKATMQLGNVHLTGSFDNAIGTNLNLSEDALVTLNANSNVGNLAMVKGSEIRLNPDKQFSKFNTLTVNGSLSGNGLFRFSTDLAALTANKLILKGNVSGEHSIALLDSGREPTKDNGSIRLIEVTKPNQTYTFTLQDKFVDAGAYRYEFSNGVLGVEKQNTIKDGPIDPNYTPPDFTKVDEEFRNQSTQAKIKDVLAKTNNRILSYDELLVKLRDAGLIKVNLDENGKILNPDEEGAVYDLSKLSPEDREKLRGNGVDLTKVNPNDLTDHTPTPKELGEVTLYDVEGALLDGVKVNTGNAGTDEVNNPTNESAKEETKTVESTITPVLPINKLENKPSQLEVVKGTQKEQMSRYSNAAVNSVTTSSKMMKQASSNLNRKLVEEKGDDVWVNYEHEQFKSNSQYFRDGKGTINSVQIGVSKKLNEDTIIGGVFNESRVSNDTNDKLNQKQTLRSGDLFVKQSIGTVFAALNLGLGEIKEKGFGTQSFAKTGVMIGNEFKWNNATLTPYANIQHYRMKGKSYKNDGANVNIEKRNVTQYGAGVDFAYDIKFDGFAIQPIVGVNYLSGEKAQSVRVNDHSFTTRFDRSIAAKYGVNVKADNVKMSLLGKSESNKEFKRNHGILAAIEVTF